MILYFSGTGNSRYVAEILGNIIQTKVLSMNEMMKHRINNTIQSDQPYIFVCPVYAGRIPRVVEQFLKESKFVGSKNAYFIVTCSETPWRTKNYVEKLRKEMGMVLSGFNSVIMPQNYIAMYDTPSNAEADKIINNSMVQIQNIGELIRNEKSLLPEKEGKRIMSSIINPVMYSFIISSKNFRVNDKCISCSQCVEKCPLNNIKIVNKKPEWGKACTHCMACISGCSKEAIEYGNKTRNRNRYFNDRKAE